MVERFATNFSGPVVEQVKECSECKGIVSEQTLTITWMKNNKLHGTYCSLECLWNVEEKCQKKKK